MEKLNITEDVKLEDVPYFEVNMESDPEIEIDSLVEWLDIAKSMGATHLELDWDVWDGSLDGLSFNPKKVRLETDDEFNKRTAKKALDGMVEQQRQKTADIKELIRLKNKLKL